MHYEWQPESTVGNRRSGAYRTADRILKLQEVELGKVMLQREDRW
jgi:hypothetical protein